MRVLSPRQLLKLTLVTAACSCLLLLAMSVLQPERLHVPKSVHLHEKESHHHELAELSSGLSSNLVPPDLQDKKDVGRHVAAPVEVPPDLRNREDAGRHVTTTPRLPRNSGSLMDLEDGHRNSSTSLQVRGLDGEVADEGPWLRRLLQQLLADVMYRISRSNKTLDESRDYHVILDILNSKHRTISEGQRDVTLVTQCSSNHLHYLVPLCENWRGPVSVAVFTYDDDFLYTIRALLYYNLCFQTVYNQVAFHLSFPKNHMPKDFRSLVDEAASAFSCSIPPTSTRQTLLNFSFKKGVEYPSNLLRNMAIVSSKTDFIFNIDIDFLPSEHLRWSFIKEVVETPEAAADLSNSSSSSSSSTSKLVYVIPAFEMLKGVPVPSNKSQLLKAWKRGKIRPYHMEDAIRLQAPTNYTRWRKLGEESGKLQVSYRAPYRDRYEPFFIARLPIPLFDERFRQFSFDRTSHACEMHLAGFQFVVLNNAFVLHDGFKGKAYNKYHTAMLQEYKRNGRLNQQFLKHMAQKYRGSNRSCTDANLQRKKIK